MAKEETLFIRKKGKCSKTIKEMLEEFKKKTTKKADIGTVWEGNMRNEDVIYDVISFTYLALMY